VDIAPIAGGPLTEVRRTFETAVEQDGLDLHFRPVAGKAIVSAIEVVRRP